MERDKAELKANFSSLRSDRQQMAKQMTKLILAAEFLQVKLSFAGIKINMQESTFARHSIAILAALRVMKILVLAQSDLPDMPCCCCADLQTSKDTQVGWACGSQSRKQVEDCSEMQHMDTEGPPA